VLSVMFRSIGPGQCAWCQKDKKEVSDVKFSDGSLDGALCPVCFRNAVRHKVSARTPKGAHKPMGVEEAQQRADEIAGEDRKS
jgi:hypothetical protein